MKNILIILMLAVLTSCAGNSQKSEEDPARKVADLNTQLGQEYLMRGDYEVAMEKLKRAINADKSYAPAHTVIAVLYEQLGETKDAGVHFHEAVKADPENGDVNNNYGAFLCRSGQGAKAERYFIAALEDPFYSTPAVAMANAGSCELGLGNMDSAEEYLRQSLAYNQNFPDALLSMAELSNRNADYLSARAFLQRFESVAAPSIESLLLGYQVETELGSASGAEEYKDKLMRQFPGSIAAQRMRESTPR